MEETFKMELVESDNSDPLFTPPTITEAAKNAATNLLPVKSKERYRRAFSDFEQWQKINDVNSTSENTLLAYFAKLQESNKPTTLWAYYSMIKTMLNLNYKIDISKYYELTAFLKRQSEGYRPRKAKVFTEEQMKSFILEAPNHEWLAVKVACIFGLCGALSTDELVNINTTDVKMYSDMFHVSVSETKNKYSRSFIVTGDFFNIVKKYKELRPAREFTNRFFINYTNGRCTAQVIGKNKFSKMPSQIAAFLNLDEPDKYTGHAFRRTSALVMGNPGATVETWKMHRDRESTSGAEHEDSVMYKERLGNESESAIEEDNPQVADVPEMQLNQDFDFDDNQELII